MHNFVGLSITAALAAAAAVLDGAHVESLLLKPKLHTKADATASPLPGYATESVSEAEDLSITISKEGRELRVKGSKVLRSADCRLKSNVDFESSDQNVSVETAKSHIKK